MKKNLSTLIILLTLLFAFENSYGAATITISKGLNVPNDVCNATAYNYKATLSGTDPSKTYTVEWTATNGSTNSSTNTSTNVTWNATTTLVSGNIGKLVAKLKIGTNVVATSNTLECTIKSIKNIKTVIPIFGGGGYYNIGACESGQLLLYADNMYVPGTGYPGQRVVDYKWLLPQGWTMDGKTSDGSTYIAGGQNVTVNYPASIVEGSIKVKGYTLVNGCTSELQESLPSDEVAVKRKYALSLNANTTKSYLLCGDTNPITFTVTPAIPCAVYYWNNSQTPSTSNSFIITPDGKTNVIVTVNIVYAGTSTIISKTINYQPFDTGVVPSIQGPNVICGNTSYTVSDLRPGYTVSWSSSSNISPVLPQNGNTGVFNSLDNNYGWIYATVNTPCGSVTATSKRVWIGEPLTPFFEVAEYMYCDGLKMVVAEENDQVVQWDMTPPLYILGPSVGNKCTFYASGYNYNGPAWIYATAQNECGTKTTVFEVDMVECPEYEYLTLVPNPASEEVEVSIMNDSNLDTNEKNSNSDQELNVRIFNSMGNNIYKTKKKDKKFKLSTSFLNDGNYIIEVDYDNKIYSKQLLIRH